MQGKDYPIISPIQIGGRELRSNFAAVPSSRSILESPNGRAFSLLNIDDQPQFVLPIKPPDFDGNEEFRDPHPSRRGDLETGCRIQIHVCLESRKYSINMIKKLSRLLMVQADRIHPEPL